MPYPYPPLCRCGSGLNRYDLLDAAGIFCQYVCEACEPEARKNWKPSIFIEGTPYAASGAEEDIDLDFFED